MRWSNQVFEQAPNSKNTTGLLASRLDSTISTTAKVHLFHASVTNAELHEHVSRAWQMDDISTQPHNYIMEENICERHFLDNVSQNSQSRYIVKLPVGEQTLNNIGNSREVCSQAIEGHREIVSSAILFLKFNTAFLDEYLSLGHMRRMEPPIAEETISFYLPHSLRLQNGQASVENPYCIRCILPQQFRRIIKRCASSETYRSTRFDLNFNVFPLFHLCHHR